MKPEEIESKIHELNEVISDKELIGKRKLEQIQKLQQELSAGAIEIMGLKKKIETFKEVLDQ